MPGLVCLANSVRHGGRCIAGIDLENGNWVRPVPRDGDALAGSDCFIDGRWLSVLDVFAVDVDQPADVPRFQRENRIIKTLTRDGSEPLRKTDLFAFCDRTTPILHTAGDRVPPAYFDKLPPEQWKSLQLLEPRKLRFERDHWKPQQWRARFEDADRNVYSLKITDDDTVRRLQAGRRVSDKCLLTVSLTKPYAAAGCSLPEQCYKIVAAVIELGAP